MQKKLKVYFTCALSGLSAEYRERMIAVQQVLKEHFEVLEFCDPKGLTPQEIYRIDIHTNVVMADMLVSIVDERSTGLGYEMGVMIEKHGRPVLALAREHAIVSPFVEGIDHEHYELQRYRTIEQVPRLALLFAMRKFPEHEMFKQKAPSV